MRDLCSIFLLGNFRIVSCVQYNDLFLLLKPLSMHSGRVESHHELERAQNRDFV
jgi:hypothetical protein